MIIRRICGGHEYRYNPDTGIVTNNYGQDVSELQVTTSAQAGITCAVLYEHGEPKIAIGSGGFLAWGRWNGTPTDDTLANFAIGHTAVWLPED